jgi:tRNA (cytidine/uridine-2'-O-)-methyltransferase
MDILYYQAHQHQLGRAKMENNQRMIERETTAARPPLRLHVALIEPEIHPNTGNIARLCAANDVALHLVGRLGFRIDDKAVRRAGLDYWPYVDLHRHHTLEEFYAALPQARFFYYTTKAEKPYTSVTYQRDDCLVFGSETSGLPRSLLEANWDHALTIPMRSPHVRSLNLAAAVAIVLYEALQHIEPF